jgi:integrase/recombinase XerC
MCYKNEQQKIAHERLENKLVDVPEFIQNYFAFLGSNKSKNVYYGTIRNFIDWLISKNVIQKQISEIKPEDMKNVEDIHVVKYLDELLLSKKITRNTAFTKKNYISGFWNYLINKNFVNKNIVTKEVSKKYKKQEKKIKAPTTEEVNELLKNIEDNSKTEIGALRNIAIVKLIIGSGIRLSECVGLDLNDLHFDEKVPKISIIRKGETDQAVIKINDVAKMAVEDYLKVRGTDSEPLFLVGKERISEGAVEKFIKIYSNKKIHPHLLRHYTGTMMHKNGVDISDIADQLGHGDLKTTHKYYVDSDETKIVEGLNSF